MFAPKAAKPQMKAAEESTLGHNPVKDVLFLQPTIGNQAALRLLARRDPSVTGREPWRQNEQEADPATRTTPGLSWDFSKVPIFPPNRVNQVEARSSLSIHRLPGIIQPKLVVGEVIDPLEHEANRVADQVVRMPGPDLPITGAPPKISRKCAACEEEEKTLRMERADGTLARGREAPTIVHEVIHAPGNQLDAPSRAFFEPRFGHDFAHVRIHDDARAARSAREVGALAYTVGHNIVFGPGEYAPTTVRGKRLLAHELTHVVQQSGGEARTGDHASRGSKTTISTPSDPAEQEAERVSEAAIGTAVDGVTPATHGVLAGGAHQIATVAPSPQVLHRQPAPEHPPSFITMARPPIFLQGNEVTCWASAIASWQQVKGLSGETDQDLVSHYGRTTCCDDEHALKGPANIQDVFAEHRLLLNLHATIDAIDLTANRVRDLILQHGHFILVWGGFLHTVVVYGFQQITAGDPARGDLPPDYNYQLFIIDPMNNAGALATSGVAGDRVAHYTDISGHEPFEIAMGMEKRAGAAPCSARTREAPAAP